MKFVCYFRAIVTLSVVFLLTACSKKEINSTTPPETRISINQTSLNVKKAEFISYRLEVKLNDIDVASTDINWSSNDTTIAKVNINGFVTPLMAGETDVTAILKNGKGAIKCHVTVSDTRKYKFRLVLKDKGTSDFSVSNPERFLSAGAIERRRKQGINIDQTDLPISSEYIKQIQDIGGVIVAKSKWLNSVSVYCTTENFKYKYKTLPFVKDVIEVWQSDYGTPNKEQEGSEPYTSNTRYGKAFANIDTENGQVLHQNGFTGEGVDIAVIDAGFKNININPMLDNIKIKGSKSFIYENINPYETDSHGVWTTSTMATNKPGKYVGTAPGANYWLLRTEDQTNEFEIEEDYMVAALEYADSAGVDIVNTSLTYTYHDGAPRALTLNDMDGKTMFATRGANMAATKGIFIVVCAGNSSNWVGAPADSPSVLAVGSVRLDRTIDYFTSFGITVDGRTKPDVVAFGSYASVVNSSGNIEARSGTSYAAPITTGLVACLWQAYPKLTNKQLLDIIRKSADKAANPQIPYGYGIPDMQMAMKLAQEVSKK